MAIVNQVQKKIRMDQWDIVKFQLTVYCYLKRIPVSDLDLNCLSLLAISGEKELGEFCDIAAKNKIFGSTQSVRNALAKAEKKNLITKNGKNKKKISLKDDMKIQAKGNILLDYKILRVEPEESKGPE
jgi:hypothetical protein